MKPKVFVDGSAGTTGLQINERLAGREDVELLRIEPAKRRDEPERKRLINSADLVFFCLPDEAAPEAVKLIDNPGTRIIDASSAHRTANGWTYGLPELSEVQKGNIQAAKKVSNPGCHATGAILLLAPLVDAGLIQRGRQISITSLTGYTGGGNVMINNYENSGRAQNPELNAPRLYGVTARHKHIPEIMRYAGLADVPLFLPIVADYAQGMQVIIPLHIPGRRREVYDILAGHYAGCKNITVYGTKSVTNKSGTGTPLYQASNVNAGSDKVSLNVLGYDDTVVLTAQFDNLGKGASGAAVQNMNIMLGFDEYEGLIL